MNAFIEELGMYEVQSWYGMDNAQAPEHYDISDYLEQENINEEPEAYELSLDTLGMSYSDFI